MGIEAALLLVVLTGGYVFASVCPPSSYSAARESGHKIYFRSVFYAVFLVICGVLVVSSVLCTWPLLLPQITISPPNSRRISTMLLELCTSNQFRAWVYMAAFVLGVLLAFLCKYLFRVIPWVETSLIKVALKNNEFEVLVFDSIEKSHPILLTLSTGKVYVGWAVKAPNPQTVRRFLRVLPLMSGFRGPTRQTVEFTTYYHEILESIANRTDDEICYMRTSDLEVVIPTDQIISAHLFDLAVHARFDPQS